MKLMGVDYGRRRIGVAVTDETGTLVRGVGTIDCKHDRDPLELLLDLIKSEAPQELVFGLPLRWDDSETAMSMEVRAFAQKLSSRIDLPLHFVDESNSSVRAAELLFSQKKKKRQNKLNTDRIAACIILENYLLENR